MPLAMLKLLVPEGEKGKLIMRNIDYIQAHAASVCKQIVRTDVRQRGVIGVSERWKRRRD